MPAWTPSNMPIVTDGPGQVGRHIAGSASTRMHGAHACHGACGHRADPSLGRPAFRSAAGIRSRARPRTRRAWLPTSMAGPRRHREPSTTAASPGPHAARGAQAPADVPAAGRLAGHRLGRRPAHAAPGAGTGVAARTGARRRAQLSAALPGSADRGAGRAACRPAPTTPSTPSGRLRLRLADRRDGRGRGARARRPAARRPRRDPVRPRVPPRRAASGYFTDHQFGALWVGNVPTPDETAEVLRARAGR